MVSLKIIFLKLLHHLWGGNELRITQVYIYILGIPQGDCLKPVHSTSSCYTSGKMRQRHLSMMQETGVLEPRGTFTLTLFGKTYQIIRFMGPTWGPSWADRTQVGPMLAPYLGWLSLDPFVPRELLVHYSVVILSDYIKGILTKGPHLPCVSMGGRALLAGYPWYVNIYNCIHYTI